MKKKNLFRHLLIITIISIFSAGFFFAPTSIAFANDGSIETSFFGEYKDDGTGCGVYTVLNNVIDILTYGIAIVATIGIIISGILYLTAKGNKTQASKAKHRLFQIVIGLLTYAMLWTILNFVLPGGNFNNSPQCSKSTGSTGLYDTDPITIEPSESKYRYFEFSDKSSSGSSSSSGGDYSKKVLESSKKVAKYLQQHHFHFDWNSGSSTIKKALKTKKVNCSKYVSWTFQDAGVIPKGVVFWSVYGHGINGPSKSMAALKKSKKVKVIQVKGKKSIKQLVKSKTITPGDAVGLYGHTMIYVNHKNGKYYFNSVNGGGEAVTYKNIIHRKFSSSTKVYGVVHIKD